ncbi:MAG: LysR family transcriptional regulator [Pseudomonadota bacterium]
MQDLKPIRVFLEVARLTSFAAAARHLGMTPATVTRTVARLEEDLGVQLLLRTTRKVSLTSTGAVVAARYGPLVEEFDQVIDDIRRASLPDRGRLRINAPMSMGLRLLPDLIESFRLAFPHVELQLSMTDHLVDIMEDGADLAIRISEPPTDKFTIWRKVCAVPRLAVAAPLLLERIDMPETPDDLHPEHCLSYSSDGTEETWHFRKDQMKRQVRAGRTIISNSGDLLHALVRRGAGIAVLPDFIVQRSLSTGKIRQILEDWTVSMLWLTLYYPPYEQLPPLVATFSDFFEAYIRDNEPELFDWS